jgi:cytochrome c2
MMAEGKMHKQDVMEMCKKCHTDLAGKGQKAGPTACKDCHKN